MSLFNEFTYTHTSYTQRELQSCFGREKTHRKVSTSTKSEEKPQTVLIVPSEETMKKHSALASNTS